MSWASVAWLVGACVWVIAAGVRLLRWRGSLAQAREEGRLAAVNYWNKHMGNVSSLRCARCQKELAPRMNPMDFGLIVDPCKCADPEPVRNLKGPRLEKFAVGDRVRVKEVLGSAPKESLSEVGTVVGIGEGGCALVKFDNMTLHVFGRGPWAYRPRELERLPLALGPYMEPEHGWHEKAAD